MKMKKPAAMAAGLMSAALLLAGCGSTNSFTGGGGWKDLEGVTPQDPTNVRLYNNVNGFPNIVLLCTDGVAFATTTREAAGAIMRIPELDATCLS